MAETISPKSKLPPTAPGFYYSPDSVNGMAQAGIDSPRLLPSKPLSLSLTWDTGQKWDGRLSLTTAHYASPNQPALANSHHLALSIPSIPTPAPEYPGDSFQPYPAEADQKFSIHAELAVTSGIALRAFGESPTGAACRSPIHHPVRSPMRWHFAAPASSRPFAVIAQGRFATASTGHRPLPPDSIFSSGLTA